MSTSTIDTPRNLVAYHADGTVNEKVTAYRRATWALWSEVNPNRVDLFEQLFATNYTHEMAKLYPPPKTLSELDQIRDSHQKSPRYGLQLFCTSRECHSLLNVRHWLGLLRRRLCLGQKQRLEHFPLRHG